MKKIKEVIMSEKGHTVTETCGCCEGSGKILTGEGHPVNCPYCKGSGKCTRKDVHPSHCMSKWTSEILAPAGTPRFYGVRHCIRCNKEEWQHAAGRFLHGLNFPCKKVLG